MTATFQVLLVFDGRTATDHLCNRCLEEVVQDEPESIAAVVSLTMHVWDDAK